MEIILQQLIILPLLHSSGSAQNVLKTPTYNLMAIDYTFSKLNVKYSYFLCKMVLSWNSKKVEDLFTHQNNYYDNETR